MKPLDILLILKKQFRYSMKIIFANKFIYFLLAAFAFFISIVVIHLFLVDTPVESNVFYFLLFPGILLIFYPTAFGIQNDDDSKMIENIFAIPNYRYKIWFFRLVMIFILVTIIIFLLAFLSSIAIIDVPIISMVFQVMFPIFFFGSFAFAISTVIKNGNGTAIVVIIVGLFFWILADPLETSAWNFFHNPFAIPNNMNEAIWENITYTNRLYLLAGTLLSILLGLFNLQKREKFV